MRIRGLIDLDGASIPIRSFHKDFIENNAEKLTRIKGSHSFERFFFKRFLMRVL